MKEIEMSLVKASRRSGAVSLAGLAIALCSTLIPAYGADIVKAGSKAPNFSLPNVSGGNSKLSDFNGKPIIVFFYDKDSVPLTEKELKSYEKYYKQFKLKGADVVGIGPNPEASHKAMQTRTIMEINFVLLKDKDDSVRAAWGIPPAEKGEHNHYCIIVDKTGTIKKVIAGHGAGQSDDEIRDALKSVGDFQLSAY
jgi:peroxiredoxin